ncbi:hypothetical protein HHK36_022966 [Tetracentron sinense]|uniref:Uncharacterized protein n=1 Tax=Tetracentron sinense TaxID=13715 RepID=A0A834YU43_TETSI|nr:hypothetical protein HHK36_022966 [Tetracentron sinense]
MGRAPCCEKVGIKKGRWTAEEDEILMNYIQANGEGSWSFRRHSNESPPIVLDLTKMSGAAKRKGGRTSRSAMKKNYNITPEKKTLKSTIVVQNEERESMVMHSYEKGEEREDLVVQGPTKKRDSLVVCMNVERESAMLCPIGEKEKGLLGPFESLDSGVMSLDEMMNHWGLDPNGYLALNEERENGVKGINEERESGVLGSLNKVTRSEEMESSGLSSNAEYGTEWNNSSMSSCFDEWEGVIELEGQDKVRDEGEEVLSWLWESDNDGGGECNRRGVDLVEDCGKQKALVAWLLS